MKKTRHFTVLDKWLRYDYARQHLDNGTEIIDVGGGRGDFFTTCGLDGIVLEMGEDAALFGRIRSHNQFVRYAGGRFPFKDRSVPVVLSMDALEHVPNEHRRMFLSEIRRISDKKVVMTFPSDRQHLTRVLLFVARIHRKIDPTSVAERSLTEHATHGLPRRADVVADFENDGWVVEATGTFGIVSSLIMTLQYAIPILALTPVTKLLARVLERADIGEDSYVFLTAHRNNRQRPV